MVNTDSLCGILRRRKTTITEDPTVQPSVAVILAGGKGTRLGSEVAQRPKPMVDICGKPLLIRQLDWLAGEGVTKVILLTGHLSQVIREHFPTGVHAGMQIEILEEGEPLGTAGALAQLQSRLAQTFWIIYGDLVANIDLLRVAQFHRLKNATATLVAHPNDHPHDSDLIQIDAESRVQQFLTKPHAPGLIARNLVNAAVYLFEPKIFSYLHLAPRGDLARDIFPTLAREQRVFAYNTPEYLKDMGTPDRLAKVRADWASGKVAALRAGQKRSVVFLDRDGVIIEYVPEIHELDKVLLRPGVGEAIGILNRAGFLVCVATNQPMIAKGFLTEAELDRIHDKMETLLGEQGAWLDRIYYCPHHPEKGFTGERIELKGDCACRKPKTGLLEQAAADFSVDKSHSWMIGDTWLDVECGQRFDLRTIGVCGGAGYPYQEKKNYEPLVLADNLLLAVDFIIKQGGAAFFASKEQ